MKFNLFKKKKATPLRKEAWDNGNRSVGDTASTELEEWDIGNSFDDEATAAEPMPHIPPHRVFEAQMQQVKPEYQSVLEIVAANGWVPWYDIETTRQNPTYSTLRLISRDMRTFMDTSTHAGPDFKAIVPFLDEKNVFGNNTDKILSIVTREQAKLLIHLLCKVAFNVLCEYYKKWRECDGDGRDLSTVDPCIWQHPWEDSSFMREFKEHNLPFYNFTILLLFTGWADDDCHANLVTHSTYHSLLLGNENLSNGWNGGYRECFYDAFQCFVDLQYSDKERSAPLKNMVAGDKESEGMLS